MEIEWHLILKIEENRNINFEVVTWLETNGIYYRQLKKLEYFQYVLYLHEIRTVHLILNLFR